MPKKDKGKEQLTQEEMLLDHNQNNKFEIFKVVNLLEDIRSKKAEIVDKTPFDNFEDNITLKLIDQNLTELSNLVSSNPYIVRKTVEGAIGPVNENVDVLREQVSEEMEALNKKIDRLLPKGKKERQVELLRDPVDRNLLAIFLSNAGNSCQRKKDLVRAQLRIAYTILYHCGLRINEIRHLSEKDLQIAIEAAQLNLVHHKTKKAHIHVLSKKAIQDLQNLKFEFLIIFEKYQYQYLFGENKPMTDKNLIKVVNKDLKFTCTKFNIPFNIKSHSFRVNMITNLLKVTSVQKAANIIGHSDIRSTMIYNRYTLSKTEIQNILDKIK